MMITYKPGKCTGWLVDEHEVDGALTLVRYLPGDYNQELLELIVCDECLEYVKAGQLYKLAARLGLVEIKPIDQVDAQPTLF